MSQKTSPRDDSKPARLNFWKVEYYTWLALFSLLFAQARAGSGSALSRALYAQIVALVFCALVSMQAEMVIARYASHHIAGNMGIDPHSLPAYHALAVHLLG